MGTRRLWIWFLTASILPLRFAGAQAADSGPSFSCAHVTSQVNKLICGSSALAALDRELALVFNNMRGQPLDQKALRREEDAWLAGLQRDCLDAACLQQRYEARIRELRDESLKVASPAAYQETRPFSAPAALLTEAQAMIGKACSSEANVRGPVIPGFPRAARFIPVILLGGITVVGEKSGVRIAFLTFVPTGETGCQIRDLAVLPPNAVGDRFLQCSAPDDPQMHGFGVRNAKTHELDGFWKVDSETHKIERVPMGVLGITKTLKCGQPEDGE